jgi:hypothetical protein
VARLHGRRRLPRAARADARPGRRRLIESGRRAGTAAIAVAAAVAATATAALALPPFTTAPKTAPGAGSGQAEVFGLTAACHATFDRLTITSRPGAPPYDVRYVARVVGDPSGLPVPLLGTARILVVLHDARAHTPAGVTLVPSTLTPLCPNLRQVKRAGDFEGVVSLGLGLSRRAGFRVFRLTAPARTVVDVAH